MRQNKTKQNLHLVRGIFASLTLTSDLSLDFFWILSLIGFLLVFLLIFAAR